MYILTILSHIYNYLSSLYLIITSLISQLLHVLLESKLGQVEHGHVGGQVDQECCESKCKDKPRSSSFIAHPGQTFVSVVKETVVHVVGDVDKTEDEAEDVCKRDEEHCQVHQPLLIHPVVLYCGNCLEDNGDRKTKQ